MSIVARILVVTGRLAEPIVRKAVEASKTKHFVEVFVAPIDVAAFMTTEYIANLLRARGIGKDMYDYVLIPGLAKGSAKVIENAIGVKAVKGCVNAVDLSELLKLDDLSILSSEIPADDVIQNMLVERNAKLLNDLEKSIGQCIYVGKLCIPISPPPIRVFSEIPFAHELQNNDLYKRVSYLVESGADGISLGFEALNPRPDDVYRVVRFLKREFDVPIAIDTEIPSEIVKGVEAECDMVINIHLGNIDKVERSVKDIAVVAIPRNPSTNSIPEKVSERVELLSKTVEYLKSRGIENVLADAILDPPSSTFNSMLAFHKFKELHPETPMFMGIGNVVELIDADSIGANALLVLLAQEIGVSTVLTTEASTKTRGSTREAKIASQMVALSKILGTPPKNLGISLLILKDKKRIETPLEETGVETVIASEEEKQYPLDPMGIFKIAVDHEEGYIKALYIGRKGKILIKGKTAKAIRNEILSRELISSLSHAIYLGIELAKAEEALKLGKNYVQELPLFQTPKPITSPKHPQS